MGVIFAAHKSLQIRTAIMFQVFQHGGRRYGANVAFVSPRARVCH